ncbi:MAG: DUF4388 domain-containing protein [Clostridia bacterium]|nr:DUF4388 domain-containing protein [Deltaproteobacteria bacterium]
MNDSKPKPRVIVVDDEAELLWTTVRRLSRERAHFDVRGFSDPLEARAAIMAQPPDVLVTDVRMPGLTGLELVVAAREVHSRLPVIIVTAFGDEEVQKFASNSALVRFLEKPCTAVEIATTIDALLAPPGGFMGSIAIPQLPDLIQIQHLSKTSCLLEITNGKRQGTLWFEKGEIIHATCDRFQAREAVLKMIAWPSGTFKVRPFAAPPKRSIKVSTMELLMDALRVFDEGARFNEDAEPLVAETAENPATSSTDRQERNQEDRHQEERHNVEQCLDEALAIDGAVGVALVDWKSGTALGTAGTGLNLEIAAAGNTEVIRAKMKVMEALGLTDAIEDILITLGTQYHLLRLSRAKPGLFFYLALKREKANLALSRQTLADIETRLVVKPSAT